MEQHAAGIAQTAAATSYGISATMVLGDWMTLIDHHTWIIGLVLGVITLTTDIIFKIINSQKLAKK